MSALCPLISKNAGSVIQRLHQDTENESMKKSGKGNQPHLQARIRREQLLRELADILKLPTLQCPLLLLSSLFHEVFSRKTLK